MKRVFGASALISSATDDAANLLQRHWVPQKAEIRSQTFNLVKKESTVDVNDEETTAIPTTATTTAAQPSFNFATVNVDNVAGCNDCARADTTPGLQSQRETGWTNIGGQAKFKGGLNDYLNQVDIEMERFEQESGPYVSEGNRGNTFCEVKTGFVDRTSFVEDGELTAEGEKTYMWQCNFQNLPQLKVDEIFSIYRTPGEFNRRIFTAGYVPGSDACFFLEDGIPELAALSSEMVNGTNFCRSRYRLFLGPSLDRELFNLIGEKKIVKEAEEEECFVFGFPSVSDQWVEKHLALQVSSGSAGFFLPQLTRGKNLFVSGDRVCQKDAGEGHKHVQVTHAFGADIGGGLLQGLNQIGAFASGTIDTQFDEAQNLVNLLGLP